MPYPTPIIEIAFDDGPYVVSPTWTDVTAYVREFSTSRGVPDDWTLQADGSATVTLSNRDRRFDPFNTAGPYYGKLLPRRQIRIRAYDQSGITPTIYDVFRGFVSGWPPEWTDAGYDSTVTLSCFDALQLLGSSSMPADWAMPYIQSLNPRHYWEMDDPVRLYTTNMLLTDRGNTVSSVYADTTKVYQGGQISLGLPSYSIGTEFGGISTSSTLGTLNQAPNTASSFTVSMWAVGTRSDLLSPSFSFSAFGGQGGIGINAFATGNGYGTAYAFFDNGSNTREWNSSIEYSTSEPHHFAFTYNAGTNTGVLYVDGFNVTTGPASNSGNTPPALESFEMFNGNFQQIAMFTSVLTQAQIQEIVRLGEGQYPETTSARVSRIIGNTPYSMSLVSTPGSPASDVLSLTPDAPTAAGELTKISDSEYAPLFVNKAGTLTLYSQSQIRTQSSSIVSQVTYGAGGVSIGTEVQLQYDGDSMRNIANVEMSYGGVYIDDNTTSVNTYGEAEQFVTTQVAAYSDAFAIGDIVTGWGGQVYPKASPVSVVLSPNASWGSTLGLELFDRFTLAVAPKTGATITLPMLLSRVSHSVTPERWSTTVEGSARWAAVFILNKSTLGGTDLLG
jgi:hypothetical protein